MAHAHGRFALNNSSYAGEFVCESAGRSERLAITHRVRDGVVSERLVSLSGSGRELVRENDEVVVYLPDRKLAIIERRWGRSDLMGALPNFDAGGLKGARSGSSPGERKGRHARPGKTRIECLIGRA